MLKTRKLFKSSALAQSIRASNLKVGTTATSAGILALAITAGMVNTAFAQEKLEEIQVTGTRISRTTMDTPTPVTTVTAADLSNMNPGSIIDALVQMPQYYGNQTPQQENGGQNSGGSNINLRGAGSNRTLVLIDGRRVVSTNRFGSVDVNSVPEDLLKNVESVTGGASASYGTDAVAGVVNFILDTKFDGFKSHVQTGITELGDGKTWETGFAFGKQITDKLHIIGSASAANQDGIADYDSLRRRPYYKNMSQVTDPDPNGPTYLVRPYVFPTNYTNNGIITAAATSPLNRMAFNPDGSLSPLDTTGLGAVSTGCQCIASPTPTHGVNSDESIQNSYRRYNTFLYGDYQLNDHTTLFSQLMYARNFTSNRWQLAPLLSIWAGRVYAENPFLSTQARNLIVANTPANAQFATFNIYPQNTPDNPLGESRENTLNHMASWTVGAKGDFSLGILKDWNYNTYLQAGENIQDFIETNGTRVDRLFLAMDAVTGPQGTPICRVNLPQYTVPIAQGGNGGLFKDCVPINLFGGTSNVSGAAANYVMDRNGKDARQWTYQRTWEFVINGDLYKGFGAGPVGAAAGVSYRGEALTQKTTNPADEYPAQVDGTLLSDQGLMPVGIRGLLPSGNSGGVAGYNGIAGLRFVPAGFTGDSNSSSVLFSSLREISGGFNVKEGFGELNIPLIKDATLIKYAEADLSARYANYSGSGGIWAWKAGLNWTITDELRFRATQSRDVRAATLRERYDQTRGGTTVTNPWNNNVTVSAASFSGGNQNVNPEQADTTTVGFVYRPSFIEGLSASIDYYSIDISDAIAQLSTQTIVNGCRLGDLTLCQYVISGTTGITDPLSNTVRPIDRVDSLFINLANQRIKGTDVEATYKTDVNLIGGAKETMALRFLYSRLDENSIQNKGALRLDRAGQIGGAGLPHDKINVSLNYNYDTWSAYVQARYIGSGLLDNTLLQSSTPVPLTARPADSTLQGCGTNICTIDNNSVPSITYVDLKVSKSFGQDNKMEAFLNVNNVFNRDPLSTPTAIGRAGTGGAFNSALYDVLGRRYTVGLNYSF